MLRTATFFAGICLSATSALAGCTEDVIAAWKRLRDSPFSFELKISDGSSRRISGAVSGPAGLHYRFDHPGGNVEHLFAGGGHWRLADGEWREDTECRRSSHCALTGIATMYDFLFGLWTDEIIDEVHDAKCLGRVTKAGKELVGYEYPVNKVLIDLPFVRERLFADLATGLPVRQELEVQHYRASNRAGWLVEADIRVDALLKIEPPSLLREGRK